MDQTPFSEQLKHLAKGTLDAELTETLAELVRDINLHGKKGSLTLKLDLKPEVAGGEVRVIAILPSVSVTVPQPQRIASHLWPTFDGDLLRQDPDQPELDLRQVDTETGEIKQL